VHDSVTVHMSAPPEQVWDLVSDVTRIGSYSPETFEAEWIDGATGPAVGARFRGHVKRNGIGPIYWTTCTVSACEPGQTFAFEIDPQRKEKMLKGLDAIGETLIAAPDIDLYEMKAALSKPWLEDA